MLTREQLGARKEGIGGSDAGVIAGLSPFKTQFELWLEKRGTIAPPDLSDNEAVHFGNVLEDVIAQEYSERTGNKVRRVNKTQYHKQYPWMLANIDRDVISSNRILEAKTAGFSVGWGAAGTDEVPETHNLQCQHYLAVTEKEIADLAVLIGGRDFRIYHIPRDDELIASLIEIESEFWDKVCIGVQPQINFNHQTTNALLSRLYPGTNGETITLPDEAYHWHMSMLEAKEKIKTYKGVVDGAKAHLLSLMGEAAKGKLRDGSGYTRKQVKVKAHNVVESEYIKLSHKKKIGG
jgi:putative phage-type endonuclease